MGSGVSVFAMWDGQVGDHPSLILARLLPGSEVSPPVRCPADRRVGIRSGTIPYLTFAERELWSLGYNIRRIKS